MNQAGRWVFQESSWKRRMSPLEWEQCEGLVYQPHQERVPSLVLSKGVVYSHPCCTEIS